MLINLANAIKPEDVSITVTSIEKIDDQYHCKVKVTVQNGWKIYGNVKFSSILENSNIIFNEGYKVGNEVYKTVIQIPEHEKGKVKFKAEFPACSNDMCMFLEKDFSIDTSIPDQSNTSSIFYILLLAFLGGLILNCMPCVLPVLSLKLHSLLNKGSSKMHMLYTWYGVMLSFIVFTAVMVGLKTVGRSIGWGMHFQNVHFLNISALFVFLFVLAVYDRIKILVSTDTEFLNNKSEKAKDIASGVVATMLAIPCTAPFLGTAAAVALDSDEWRMALIFMTIGLGFGLPYLIFSVFNFNISIKPGRWMNMLKHVLGLGIIGTFVWLLWLLSNHLNVVQMALLSIGYLLLFLFISKSWILSIVAGVAICLSPLIMPNYHSNVYHVTGGKRMWIKFDPVKLQNYIKQGKIVFVNVTADWCMTCKYNKRVLLDTNEFFQLIKKYGVVCMEGDLTYNNDMVSLFLKMHNQGGIPFNIVFGPNAMSGFKLGVVPTLNEVEKALKKAGDQED